MCHNVTVQQMTDDRCWQRLPSLPRKCTKAIGGGDAGNRHVSQKCHSFRGRYPSQLAAAVQSGMRLYATSTAERLCVITPCQ